MRLIRFGPPGEEQPGVWQDGRIHPLRDRLPDIPDIGEVFFREGWLTKIRSLDIPVDIPGCKLNVRLGPPLNRPSKIICVGKNYAAHAREGGFETPEDPILFAKAPSALSGPEDPIRIPAGNPKVDWEAELAVVMGRKGRGIKPKDAHTYIAGYTVMNDVSGRAAQFGDGQWFRGKSFDTFAPLGPWIVTPDELNGSPDLASGLSLGTRVNGVEMQSGNTRDMIFDIPHLLEYISRDITLYPGDIVSTGTPEGVGIFRDPPVVLHPGDVVECWVEGIGTLKNQCK
jgi:2-keto-4-pentenoate hydratase/2-oxohepta-3-ene-1,7-dioic acid hydratase in catechol pathway